MENAIYGSNTIRMAGLLEFETGEKREILRCKFWSKFKLENGGKFSKI